MRGPQAANTVSQLWDWPKMGVCSGLQYRTFLAGDSSEDDINGRRVTYLGTGNPTQCLNIMREFVYKVESKRCHPKPCAIGMRAYPREF